MCNLILSQKDCMGTPKYCPDVAINSIFFNNVLNISVYSAYSDLFSTYFKYCVGFSNIISIVTEQIYNILMCFSFFFFFSIIETFFSHCLILSIISERKPIFLLNFKKSINAVVILLVKQLIYCVY